MPFTVWEPAPNRFKPWSTRTRLRLARNAVSRINLAGDRQNARSEHANVLREPPRDFEKAACDFGRNQQYVVMPSEPHSDLLPCRFLPAERRPTTVVCTFVSQRVREAVTIIEHRDVNGRLTNRLISFAPVDLSASVHCA